MQPWTLGKGYLSCSMSHRESGDADMFNWGIEHFETAIPAVQCPIRHPQTQTSLNAALNTSKRLYEQFNKPFGIRRPGTLWMRHWALRKAYLSFSKPNLESGGPDLFRCVIEHFKKGIAAVQCPIWDTGTQTFLIAALNTWKMLSQRCNAAFGIRRPEPL